MAESEVEFSKDMLRGGRAIAKFLFGDGELRGKVYHLAETSRLPTFKLGSVLCARKSVLLKWVAGQEERHTPEADTDTDANTKNESENANDNKPNS